MSEVFCADPTQQSVLNRVSKDKFLLVLNLPQYLRDQSTRDALIDIDPLQLSIYGAVVPTVRIANIELPFAGQVYNLTSHARPNYEPLNVNFVVDNKFRNYWILWKWLALLNTPRNSLYGGSSVLNDKKDFKKQIERGNLTEYQTNLSVLGLNEYNQKSIEFIYYNAFITTLGGINYSYRDAEIMESTVQFQYSQLDVQIFK